MESAAFSMPLISRMACLADAKRLRLLRLLEQHELGVTDLCDVLQSPQSTISRHLKLLLEQDWLRTRQQGTNHLYRMILDELDPATRQLWLVAREQTEQWAAAAQDRMRLERLLRERETGESFFAGAATEWDTLRGQLYGSAFSTAACLALLPGDSVVADLGCGTGRIAELLAPNVAVVIGVDNSPPMLKAARRRLEKYSNAELRRGDLAALPIEDAACDAALLVLALTYVVEPVAVLREMRRILKPGGKAVIVDLLPHDRDDFRRQFGQRWLGFEPERLRDELSAVGFEAIALRPLPPEPEAKGPALFLASGARKNA